MTRRGLVHLALRPGEWRPARGLAAELELPERAVTAALTRLESARLVGSEFSAGRRWYRRLTWQVPPRLVDSPPSPLVGDLAYIVEDLHGIAAGLVAAGLTTAAACAAVGMRVAAEGRWS